MATLYKTTTEPKTLEIDTTREGFPFRLVFTLRKLGTVSMLDYFVRSEEAQEIIPALQREVGRFVESRISC